MLRFSRWGLFSRTFLLLTALMLASLVAWLQAFRNMELEPRAHQMAQQIVTAVNITRAALVYSAPLRRRFLLLDLATNEGIQIYPRDPADRTLPLPDTALLSLVSNAIIQQLGQETRIMWEVNGMGGLWVSFSIGEDHYWAVLDRTRTERRDGVQWLGWGLAALLLSLLGAAVIVGFVNRPLSRLVRATQTLSRGETPPPLPETGGPDEIRSVNASFNRMVDELARTEADRALMLAGISHDLRTPLARIRLEIEMTPMSDESMAGIDHDLAQIEHTIGQFMEYAQPVSTHTGEPVVLADHLDELLQREQRHTEAQGGRLDVFLDRSLMAIVPPFDLGRAVSNLIENARRYGQIGDQPPEIEARMYQQGNEVLIDISDRGPGVSEDERERLLRPFTRGAQARTNAGGAGLGLSIVHRLLTSTGGSLELINRKGGGLTARIRLPRVAK